ncbi:hypothetical protein EST38_g11422 [Candolleomyces aberdarensis]|uniref:Uncharacterized protein n=1 Tax=Candolleomyces aberdarensis TaxID=2316362 RepID=A0A4Q2D6E3_9AGAR|nr:hypothetical protein EST38_g11422 [Candolleomyces aberdarensis]
MDVDSELDEDKKLQQEVATEPHISDNNETGFPSPSGDNTARTPGLSPPPMSEDTKHDVPPLDPVLPQEGSQSDAGPTPPSGEEQIPDGHEIATCAPGLSPPPLGNTKPDVPPLNPVLPREESKPDTEPTPRPARKDKMPDGHKIAGRSDMIKMDVGSDGEEETDSNEEEETEATGSSKLPKKKQKHLSSNWKNLKRKKRIELTRKGSEAMDLFTKFNRPLSDQVRCWVRRYSGYLPIAGTHSQRLAASCFILNNSRTVCHYHTVYEHGLKNLNDSSKKQKNENKVTGVPFAPEPFEVDEEGNAKKPKKDQDLEILMPKHGLAEGQWNPHFTLQNVLSFFLVKEGRHILHCGCILEDALMDLFMWKTVKLHSISLGIEETFGKPVKPRERAYMVESMDYLCCFLEDIYGYKDNGTKRSMVEIRECQIRKLLAEIRRLRQEEAEVEKTKKDAYLQKAVYVELENLTGINVSDAEFFGDDK